MKEMMTKKKKIELKRPMCALGTCKRYLDTVHSLSTHFFDVAI